VLKAFHAKLQEIETSQIAINKQQKVDQVKKALDQAVANLLEGEEKRTRYQNRLFEMAAFLSRTGEEQPARQAAAAAWQLSVEDFQPTDSVFFEKLIKKMFRSPEEIVEQMTKAEDAGNQDSPPEPTPSDPGNLIVPP
jgi:hypothetical protein